VDKPIRARGVDTPHTLDLVISEEFFFTKFELWIALIRKKWSLRFE